MRLESAGKTHVGMKRNHNEDNYLLMPEENLFCVADGMGGHSSGEIASKIAVTEVSEFFKYTAKDRDITWPFKMDKNRNYDENRLSTAVKVANARIFEASQAEAKYRGMGTTIVSVYFANADTLVGHVGDSRVYRFIAAEQKLVQLTEDHSLLNDYIKAKKLTPEEIENFPHKNVIVRALGMKDSVVVDVTRLQPAENDIFLLCSDGLSGMVTDPKMEEILQKQPDIDKAAQNMIDAANAAGGNDNVSCILIRWHAS
ncbi:MAG TPA: Stp1/IreP family PP2C-type Ser/Thr phosphatase [Myxococcales bacterium]|jgi:protein phosphatase